jgi:hypothetical protein
LKCEVWESWAFQSSFRPVFLETEVRGAKMIEKIGGDQVSFASLSPEIWSVLVAVGMFEISHCKYLNFSVLPAKQ